MVKRKVLILAILPALVIISGLIYYQQIKVEHAKNEELEIKLLNKISGERAVELIKRIHIGDFYLEDAEIREYSGGIRIWIAYVNSSEVAESYVKRMAKKVSIYFSEPSVVKIDSLSAYRVYSSGKTHYFFSFKNSVIWIEFENPSFEFHKIAIKKILMSE